MRGPLFLLTIFAPHSDDAGYFLQEPGIGGNRFIVNLNQRLSSLFRSRLKQVSGPRYPGVQRIQVVYKMTDLSVNLLIQGSYDYS